ncbi:MAG: AMP-binding protein [Rhodobacteraceae bacterium]|nr:AMP-binding protein [Paracoccaceae bacterium]
MRKENVSGQGFKCSANYTALTPLSHIARAAEVFASGDAISYGTIRWTWAEVTNRCARMASALRSAGVTRGDVVSTVLPNIPAAIEAHFSVPMAGAVLNAINTRLDDVAIAYILGHAESKIIFVDSQHIDLVERAMSHMNGDGPTIIECPDTEAGWQPTGRYPIYDDLIEKSEALEQWHYPEDEWDSIALNYTSGTTGNPKGVLYHHRGAYLTTTGAVISWEMGIKPRYLSIVPQFHCNAWCHIWTMPLVGGTIVCCRDISAKVIFDALADQNVSHFGCAPIVLNMLIHADPAERREFTQPGSVVTAGAPPAPSTIKGAEALGLKIKQVYGLTETFGHISEALEQPDWKLLGDDQRYAQMARIGVRFPTMEGLDVADPETGKMVPWDGTTTGEIVIRGNSVMKGYFKNDTATEESFKGGWFWSGDIGVRYPDGYISITDRTKDIIISGGENISSVEIENVLMQHPDVSLCAVVAKPDEKWGEVPCAFVELLDGRQVSRDVLVAFCREHLAGFKCPKDVRFETLPKTSTGKVQKFELRRSLK